MPVLTETNSNVPNPEALRPVAVLRRILMADPSGFDIVESINAHMRDERGELNKIDRAEARRQWEALKNCYESVGVAVSVLDAPPGHVDFCFAANPSLVLPLPDGSVEMWISKMAHRSRRGEEKAHLEFAVNNGFRIAHMPEHVARFEGTGDAILHPGRFFIHAGVGPRSDAAAWQALADAHPELVIQTYELNNPHYYHLDTALVMLDGRRAMFVREAFTARGLERLRGIFPVLFEIPGEEAMRFAGNAHCPDLRHVILQKGNGRTSAWLRGEGFSVHEVETGEFIKSGGSVFCLKLAW